MGNDLTQKAVADTRRFLKKWEGGDAAISGARVGHKILTIRVIADGQSGYLEITCGDCEHISGPFRWLGASFELIEHTDGPLPEYILRDVGNGFSIRCGLVGAQEKTYK